MGFPENLKKLRVKKNYSQDDLAKMLKITQQNISQYERGLATPGIEALTQLADLFDVSVDFLIDYKKHPCHTGLSKDALELLELFDELPPNQKTTSLEILKVLKNSSKKEM